MKFYIKSIFFTVQMLCSHLSGLSCASNFYNKVSQNTGQSLMKVPSKSTN